MRIVGISFCSGDGNDCTILLRNPTSVFGPTVRNALAWFFYHAPAELQEAPLPVVPRFSIRIETDYDPFHVERVQKMPRFDGKGLTLERQFGAPSYIHVDYAFNVPVDQFMMLCRGLYYAAANDGHLNVLLRPQPFFQFVGNPDQLWKVMFNCMGCKAFSELRDGDAEFKRIARNKVLTVRAHNCVILLEELQDRLTGSAMRKELDKHLHKIKNKVHALEAAQIACKIDRSKVMLEEVSHSKAQLCRSRQRCEQQVDFASINDIGTELITLLKNDLLCVLNVCGENLECAQEGMDMLSTNETFQQNVLGMMSNIQKAVKNMTNMASTSYETEKASCAIQNNLSLMLLQAAKESSCAPDFVADLLENKKNLIQNMRSATLAWKEKKTEVATALRKLDKFKELLLNSNSSASRFSVLEAILTRMHETLANHCEASVETGKLEGIVLDCEKNAWMKHLDISSLPYEELRCIAAVRAAVSESGTNVQEDFQGFLYEWAVNHDSQLEWTEHVSFVAIFQTSAMAAVVEKVVKERNVRNFQYIIVQNVNQMTSALQRLVETGVPIRRGRQERSDLQRQYGNMLEVVNEVVECLVEMFQAKGKIRTLRTSLQHSNMNFESSLAELNNWCRNHEKHLMSFTPEQYNFRALPFALEQVNIATRRRSQLQARIDSMTALIEHVERGSLLSMAQLQAEGEQLDLTMASVRTGSATKKQQYCDDLAKLTESCGGLEFTLNLFQQHLPSKMLLPADTYRMLIDHWTACTATINRAVSGLETVTSNITSLSTDELDVYTDPLLALELQEMSISARITELQRTLEEYEREHPSVARGAVSGSSQEAMASETALLLQSITALQRELPEHHLALKRTETTRLQHEIQLLQQLERDSFRELYLNNLILPTVDTLHVQLLREMTQLLTAVSKDQSDLLGGAVELSFYYRDSDGEERDRNRGSLGRNSFIKRNISGVNIQIVDEQSQPVEAVADGQLQLAYFLTYVSFLYVDGCRLIIMDDTFKNLFGGIDRMLPVLETHFPLMQFIRVRGISDEC